VHTTLNTVHLEQAVDGDLRCDCGKLLARVLRAVLELKCPRCKRVVLVVGGQRFVPTGASSCTCTIAPTHRLPPEDPGD
jgi:glycerate-2-kinase